MERKRKQYYTCPYCGGHLDYGEKCTCREEAGQNHQEPERQLCSGVDRQMEGRRLSCGR